MSESQVKYEEIVINGRVLQRQVPTEYEKRVNRLEIERLRREDPEASQWADDFIERLRTETESNREAAA
ncbi:hypothetical protein [Haloglycomyces albus]|uniref:hypothetical protein n=1 Tax=Haloglycomyces albus TaxID=526067 RepID=UPI00046CC1D5|nr:hypothetical protein [Haloglycomyces albus]